MSRPEHIAPPEIYYGETEAAKYAHNSRMVKIQSDLTERAYELLALPPSTPPLLIGDFGCGTGLSTDVLTEHGHHVVGLDISLPMLEVALSREVGEDLISRDLGEGVPFRTGVFDAIISISALQWLCNADKSSQNPIRRLKLFFDTAFASLRKGGRAVFQFYPENATQIEMITTSAMKCGFTGGLVVDFPHSTKAKKYYLVLTAGVGERKTPTLPPSTVPEEKTASFIEERIATRKRKGKHERVTVKQWIIQKKESMRRKGKEVRADSKYTGRKRSKKF